MFSMNFISYSKVGVKIYYERGHWFPNSGEPLNPVILLMKKWRPRQVKTAWTHSQIMGIVGTLRMTLPSVARTLWFNYVCTVAQLSHSLLCLPK